MIKKTGLKHEMIVRNGGLQRRIRVHSDSLNETMQFEEERSNLWQPRCKTSLNSSHDRATFKKEEDQEE